MKGPHGEVDGAAVVDSKLFGEVIQRVKVVAGVKPFLVLPVAAFRLAVVAGCIRTDEFVPDAWFSGGSFKQGGKVPLAVGKAVGELKTVIRLDALHPDASAGIPFDQLFQEIGRGISGLLRISPQETQTGELVNSRILEQAKLLVCNTPAGHYLHIYLYPLPWVRHLLVRLGFVCVFLLGLREQSQLAHDPEQALRAAGIAPLPQAVPQFHHAQFGITAAHIPDQLQFCLGVLVWMTMGPPGSAG